MAFRLTGRRTSHEFQGARVGDDLGRRVFTMIQREGRVAVEDLVQKVSPDGKDASKVVDYAEFFVDASLCVGKRQEGGETYYVAK